MCGVRRVYVLQFRQRFSIYSTHDPLEPNLINYRPYRAMYITNDGHHFGIKDISITTARPKLTILQHSRGARLRYTLSSLPDICHRKLTHIRARCFFQSFSGKWGEGWVGKELTYYILPVRKYRSGEKKRKNERCLFVTGINSCKTCPMQCTFGGTVYFLVKVALSI